MHEFALAENVIEIAKEAATKAGKEKVTSITLEVGILSGVEKEALLTALEVIQNEIPDNRTKITIIEIQGVAYCSKCHKKFSVDTLFSLCPFCQGYEKEIISGKEFNVVSIEAE